MHFFGHKVHRWLLLGLAFACLSSSAWAQCLEQSGYQGEVILNSASGTLRSPDHRTHVIVGQPFISPPTYSNDQSHVAGYWGRLLKSPSLGVLQASDGEQPDRIVLQWELEPNTSDPTQGYRIYRDGLLLTTVSANATSFLDYNVIPGVYYDYAVSALNQYGEGPKVRDVGYVNPNGVISGRITTFSGRSVANAVVSLSPSTNRSLFFDGSGAMFVDTLKEQAEALLTGEFTLSFWVKVDAFHNEGMIFDYGKLDSQNLWAEVKADSSVAVTLSGQSGPKTVQVSLRDDPHAWHQVTAVYNGQDLMMYLNGQVMASASIPQSEVQYVPHRIGIGGYAYRGDQSNRFMGYLDDLRLLNRTQRPSQIRAFLHNTLPRDYPGLVAYWKMDEGKGYRTANLADLRYPGLLCDVNYSAEEPGVRNSGMTNESGYYVIADVNYGSGTTFSVEPSLYVSFNYALEFNHLEAQYAETPGFGLAQDATLELWFSPYRLSGTQYLLSAKGPTQFDLYLEGTELKLNLAGQVETLGNITTTDYHFLSITRQGGSFTTYLDADPQTAHTFSSSVSSIIGKTTWNLGTSAQQTNYYSGLIDAVIAWNEALDIPTLQLHHVKGVPDITTEVDGFTVVDERISAFIGLNEAKGDEIANEIPVNGNVEWGTVHGAGFADLTAHSRGVDHQFDPNARIITLNQSSTSADGIDFTNISTVPVSGIFKYENTNCFIAGAEVLVNGEPTFPPTVTDEEGKFTVEMEPGASAILTVSYRDHEIFPNFYEVRNIQTPKAGVLFEDKTKRSLSGIVAGGLCELPIVPEQGQAVVNLTSTDGCFTQEITIDDQNTTGAYQFEDIPPLEYNVSITKHTLRMVKDYFDAAGGETVSVVDSSQSGVDFIYFAPPQVELSPLDTNNCGDPMLEQSRRYATQVKVYEDYLGQRCYLEHADLTISDGIGESVEEDFDGTAKLEEGSYLYQFAAGEANIVAPYLKALQVVADVDGATASATLEAVVLGQRKRQSTFTSTTPEVPVAILRDPPGDGSYSYLEKSQELCLSGMAFTSVGQTIGSSATKEAGKDVTINTGAPGATKETTVDMTASLTASMSSSVSAGASVEYSACFSATENIATSEDLIGAEGDIYIGAAINLTYGLTDNLIYDSTTCSYRIFQRLVVDPSGFETFYLYSQQHILNDVIPSNYLLGDIPSAEAWENFIVLNQRAKDQASFRENRSFDAGVNYETSSTFTSEGVVSVDFSMDLSQSLEGEKGVETDGVGFTLGNSIELTLSFGGTASTGKSDSRTVGYVLADDDIGDNFTVDISEDGEFGTPVFELKSGESSCPYEDNTVPREGVQILVNNNRQATLTNVSTDQAAIFDLYLGNTSQTDEEQTYAVDVVNASNPYGAQLSINGAPLVATSGGSGVTYTLPPNQGQLVKLALERGLDPNIFDYDSIQVVFQSLCDEQISDTVLVSAHFVEPCSYVELSDPQEGWVITPADSGLMAFVIDSYDETDPELELVRLQFRATGAPSWINITEIPADSLGEVFTLHTWDIGELKDGPYQVRAISVCSGGLPSGFSEVVNGVIEQQPPEVLGTPQPADGVLEPGDEISVTFTEPINCGEIYYADQFNLNNIGLYNLTTSSLINADVQCLGNKIVITPQIPSLFMENQTLELRISGIEDLVGNVLPPSKTGSPVHKWDFYVNVSPVGWVGAAVDESKLVGEPHSFTRNLKNDGGDPVNFALDLPRYLTATPSQGTLPPDGEITVQFAVDPQLAIGAYRDSLTVQTSYGEEWLPLDLRVICPPPNWTFDPAPYSFNMNFTLALDIEGDASTDPYDLIAGFVDGQLRGVGNVAYVEALDKHLVFLSVYGEAVDQGKTVTFRVWDASQCKLYDQTEESFAFAPNGQVGSPLVEQWIHTRALLARTMRFRRGWNWVSFNLNLDNDSVDAVMAPLAQPLDGMVKSQSQFSQYFAPAQRWVGSLAALDERQMYQVYLPGADSLDFLGVPINVDSTTIPMGPGWNWIGYLPQDGMTPDEALASLTPFNGDLIKNQFFFAQYVAGIGWIGNLSFLRPQAGYLYYSSSVDTLRYPATSQSGPGKREDESLLAQQEQWEALTRLMGDARLNPYAFSHNMNVVAQLRGVPAEEGDQLLAYLDGEIRGAAVAQYVPSEGRHLFFLTILAQDEESSAPVSFQVYRPTSGEVFTVQEELAFSADGLVGLVQQAYPLTLGEARTTGVASLHEAASEGLTVYPNPSTPETVISYRSTQAGTAQLKIYDAVGRVLAQRSLEVQPGVNEFLFRDFLPLEQQSSGVYNLSIQSGDKLFQATLIKE